MKTNRIAAFCSVASPVRTLVEHLESRELLSAAPVLPAAAPAVKHGGDVAALFQNLDRRHNIKTTFPIQINSVSVNNGQLVANGMIGNQPFHALTYAGQRYDCGTRLGFLEANCAVALNRDDTKVETHALLGRLLKG